MIKTSKMRALLLVATAAGVLAVGLYRVHQRHQLIEVGYKLNQARNRLRTLQEEQNRLRLEESVLTSPERIERLATALGMTRPSPSQLRIIPASNSVAFRK